MLKRLRLLIYEYKFIKRAKREDFIRGRERARKPLPLPIDELEIGGCSYTVDYPEDE